MRLLTTMNWKVIRFKNKTVNKILRKEKGEKKIKLKLLFLFFFIYFYTFKTKSMNHVEEKKANIWEILKEETSVKYR